jgi:hypothetical protein
MALFEPNTVSSSWGVVHTPTFIYLSFPLFFLLEHVLLSKSGVFGGFI